MGSTNEIKDSAEYERGQKMNPALVWHVLYPLYHRVKRTRFFDDLAGLQANERLAPEALSKVQLEKLKTLVRHAYDTTLFYKDRVG